MTTQQDINKILYVFRFFTATNLEFTEEELLVFFNDPSQGSNRTQLLDIDELRNILEVLKSNCLLSTKTDPSPNGDLITKYGSIFTYLPAFSVDQLEKLCRQRKFFDEAKISESH